MRIRVGMEKENVVELLPLSGGKPNWERTGMSLSGIGSPTNPNSGSQKRVPIKDRLSLSRIGFSLSWISNLSH